MIKTSALEFHQTFQPEMAYIARILKLAAEEFSGTKFEISDCTGIPTGNQKGKVEPHIRYANCMGLVDFTFQNKIYSLKLTPLGREVYSQDPHLHEKITVWLCHYGMTKKESIAPQWEYLVQSAHPGFGEVLSQKYLFSSAAMWCEVPVENMSKKVFSVVKSSYGEGGCFQPLRFLTWNDDIEFNEQSEKYDMLYVYAYALLDSWERLFPDKREITEIELKEEIGFNKIFGFGEEEFGDVLNLLADEGIISVNRQLFPATIIRTSVLTDAVFQMYSRLL